jgi:hypothetical protein
MILKLKVEYSSETSANSYRTTPHKAAENNTIHSHHREDFMDILHHQSDVVCALGLKQQNVHVHYMQTKSIDRLTQTQTDITHMYSI